MVLADVFVIYIARGMYMTPNVNPYGNVNKMSNHCTCDYCDYVLYII